MTAVNIALMEGSMAYRADQPKGENGTIPSGL